jgi:hypothetical protein
VLYTAVPELDTAMQTKTTGYLAWIAALVALTAQSSEPAPIYLSGYYRFYERNFVWQDGDGMPWYVLKNAAWADPRLVNWGYVPVSHDAQDYYCLINHGAPTGSRIPLWLFACGDPATAERLYNSHRVPVVLWDGGPH